MLSLFIAQVVLEDPVIHHRLPDGRSLRRGSIVRPTGEACALESAAADAAADTAAGDTAGHLAALLLLHPLYAAPGPEPAPGELLCLPDHLLAAPLEALGPDGHSGPLRLDALGLPRIGGRPVGWDQVRPMEPPEAGALSALRAGWARSLPDLPPLPPDMLRSTVAGYVALPLQPRTPGRLRRDAIRESLLTPAQLERQISHDGPLIDGVPVYVHFTGADLPDSDLWGPPGFILRLSGLLYGWNRSCRADLRPGDPARCTVAVGDLAWYTPLLPDPLGHKDHAEGGCADLRLFRADGSAYEAWWNRPDDRPAFAADGIPYDRSLTLQFLRFAREHGADPVFFNDPAAHIRVGGALLARPLAGHDDHAHLCLRD